MSTTETTYIVLLRAINVGGRNPIPMAELRSLLDELGFSEVQTYIQSGNVVCTSNRTAAEVAIAVHDGIEARFGHEVEVIVRTADDLERIVGAWPYGDADPKSSGVVFLSGPTDAALDASKFAPDECLALDQDVFVNCPTRFSNTKLTAAWIENQTGRAGTRRNWATVLRLHSMASS